MPFHIVLVEPLIPQNTGNIARLTAATDSELHLIAPLGFELSDAKLKRAGLDYWPHVKLSVHQSFADFLKNTKARREQLWVFSTHADCLYHQVTFKSGDYLLFGNESHGLPEFYHREYGDRRLKIPISNQNIRSLNLANAAAVGLYEALRQESPGACQTVYGEKV